MATAIWTRCCRLPGRTALPMRWLCATEYKPGWISATRLISRAKSPILFAGLPAVPANGSNIMQFRLLPLA
ncbi:hypothetical protein EOB77_32280, partial [Mesorhizobium sp. M7A.F.Ca.MR.228.00.0.0]